MVIGNGISIIIFAGIVAGLPGGASAVCSSSFPPAPSARLAAIFVIAIVMLGVTAFCRLRRTRTAPHYRQLRQASGRQPHLRRPELLSSSEDEHGRRDSADLCIFADSLSGDFSQLVYQLATPLVGFVTLAASLSPGQPLYTLLYAALDRFLCILLHGIGFQSERNCREPQEERCVSFPGIRPGEQTSRYIDKCPASLNTWPVRSI